MKALKSEKAKQMNVDERTHNVLMKATLRSSKIVNKKPLSEEKIEKIAMKMLSPYFCMYDNIQFAREIEKEHGIL